jgi:hypothetical protein
VAKYRHRCGHRHLSNQVNSVAAPEAPPTKHSKESVLNGGFQRVTHRAGGKKASHVDMGISPYRWLRLRRHPCHQCELFGTWKILFRRCEHSNTDCNSHGVLLCCLCLKPSLLACLGSSNPLGSSFLHLRTYEQQDGFRWSPMMYHADARCALWREGNDFHYDYVQYCHSRIPTKSWRGFTRTRKSLFVESTPNSNQDPCPST